MTQCISGTSQKRQVRRTHSLSTPIFIFLSTSVLRLSPHRFSPSLKNTSHLLMVLNFFVPLSSFPSQGGASRKVFSLLSPDSDACCLMRHAVWDFEGQTSLNKREDFQEPKSEIRLKAFNLVNECEKERSFRNKDGR